jgi:hypothetical protein
LGHHAARLAVFPVTRAGAEPWEVTMSDTMLSRILMLLGLWIIALMPLLFM